MKTLLEYEERKDVIGMLREVGEIVGHDLNFSIFNRGLLLAALSQKNDFLRAAEKIAGLERPSNGDVEALGPVSPALVTSMEISSPTLQWAPQPHFSIRHPGHGWLGLTEISPSSIHLDFLLSRFASYLVGRDRFDLSSGI
jgi:hypothetical protein